MRGAVLYGLSLNQATIPMVDIPSVDNRMARFSYGVSAAEPFLPGFHPASKMYFDPFTGEFMCSDRMQWFVEKVQKLFKDNLKSTSGPS